MFQSSFILPQLHLCITSLTEKLIYLQSSNTSSQVFILVNFCNDSSLCMETFHLGSFLCLLCLVTQSCSILCDPIDCNPSGSSVHGDSQGKNTGVGFHALHQGISPTQGSDPVLLHCRQILYCLSHQRLFLLKNSKPTHMPLLWQISPDRSI